MKSRKRGVAPVLAILLTACSTAPRPYMGSPERGQMLAHFDLAVEMRGHAIQADVERFRDAAARLDELEPAADLSPEVILQLGPMRWEARAGANAATPEEAAYATAEIARTCGDCHRANGVTLADRFVLTMPTPTEDAQRHMVGLAWVTVLLWEGLVGPSEAAWAVGSEALMESGALPNELMETMPPRDVEHASRALRRLGREASGATAVEDRVQALGEIWAVCAGCHANRTER